MLNSPHTGEPLVSKEATCPEPSSDLQSRPSSAPYTVSSSMLLLQTQALVNSITIPMNDPDTPGGPIILGVSPPDMKSQYLRWSRGNLMPVTNNRPSTEGRNSVWKTVRK
ncbi:hypothetical protein RUM43_009298 [Polyplax serrata]|uniref:Uncharacterized protein n=1 Tax=Polyplax serrata TaxID=468196 RepID=A0AAN8S124_POLSC